MVYRDSKKLKLIKDLRKDLANLKPDKGNGAVLISKGRYTYDVHKNCPIFKTHHPPCPATSKIFPPS